MKKNIIILISIFLFGHIINGNAQSRGQIAINLKEKSQNSRFITYRHLLKATDDFDASLIGDEVSNATVFNLDKAKALSIIERSPALISIEINNEITLDLYKEMDAFSSLLISTSSGAAFDFNSLKAVFYRGVIKGNENSLVSLCIFENEIAGFISYQEGNLVLGKLRNGNQMILYNDKDLKEKLKFDCTTPNLPMSTSEVESYKNVFSKSLTQKCVRLYFETTYEVFHHYGSVTNVISLVTFIYNQVGTLYANDGIGTALSHIKVWDYQSDPYNAHASELASNGGIPFLLSQFQANTSSINGDLGQLITFNTGDPGPIGGKAAGFSGICNSNVDQSLCVSVNTTDLASVPTYSWDVSVVTHEFGHLMGSRHTHACVWNTNGTAIDGCGPTYNSQYQEGSCAIGPIPQGGGTIMSYCHLLSGVGINFSNGFGPQPTAVITNNVNNGACLKICCPDDLVITTNVASPNADYRQAQNTITATNTIGNGATGIYHAGSQVIFQNGFNAAVGSNFRAYIEGCSDKFVARPPSSYQDGSTMSLSDQEIENLILAPNPTNGVFSLNLKEPTNGIIQIFNLRGTLVYKKEFKNEVRFEIDIREKAKGIYIVKVSTDKANMIGKIIKN